MEHRYLPSKCFLRGRKLTHKDFMEMFMSSACTTKYSILLSNLQEKITYDLCNFSRSHCHIKSANTRTMYCNLEMLRVNKVFNSCMWVFIKNQGDTGNPHVM